VKADIVHCYVGNAVSAEAALRRIHVMPRGYTQARFHNAKGEVIETTEMPTNRIFPKLNIPSSLTLTKKLNSDTISFVEARKPNHWFAYHVETFEKRAPSSGPGVDYDFVEERIVARCAALTQQGRHCKNEAEKGSMFCHSAHRPEKGSFPLIDDPFLIYEFEEIAALVDLNPYYEKLKKEYE